MTQIQLFETTMSSRTIAALTGKRHFHVMRDIQYLEPSYAEAFGESKFGLSSYLSDQKKQLPEYILTKSQTLFIVSGYDAVLRGKIQKRWEELEAKELEAKKPLALPSAKELALQVYEAYEQIEAKDRLIVEKTEQIVAQEPSVQFVNLVVADKTLYTMDEAAKLLGTGRQRLFDLLREHGIIMQHHSRPVQQFIEAGLFDVKWHHNRHHRTPQALVTGKGLVWIKKKFDL